ncbi:hypothetical protein TcWFU_001407 [Taenia crassiceps]
MRTFMKLFVEFILSLKDTEGGGDFGGGKSLCQMVDGCFQRLASSPVGTVWCFGLSIDNMQMMGRRTGKGNKKSTGVSNPAKDSSQSVVEIMLSHLGVFVHNVVKVSGREDGAVRSNVSVLSQAMANICSTIEGREYFTHSKAAREMQTIAQILAKCLDVVVAVDVIGTYCGRSGSLVEVVMKVVGHLCDVLSKTLLLPQSRQSRVRAEVVRKVLEVLKVLRLKRDNASGE